LRHLPNLVRRSFVGPITRPGPAHITDLLLRDAAHIQESDAAYFNKKHPVSLPSSRCTPWPTPPGRGTIPPADLPQTVRARTGAHVTLVDAGHILGSAGVVLDLRRRVDGCG
jgi:metallo-beta-lactamase family protein